MKIDQWHRNNPSLYGIELLKTMYSVLGKNDHYIDEYAVLDFLGYTVEKVDINKVIDPDRKEEKSGINKGSKIDAILSHHYNIVLISDYLSDTRTRMTLFHEIGHIIIPWHHKIGYVTRRNSINSVLNKKIEREAFEAGIELMFPINHFLRDSKSQPISFTTIKYLAHKYRASFESTCLRYVKTNPNPVAIVILKPDQDSFMWEKEDDDFYIPTRSEDLALKNTDFSLQILYGVQSKRYLSYFKPGVKIKKSGMGQMFYKCWFEEKPYIGKILASLFESKKDYIYNAECLYYFNRVYVLLIIPDNQ